MRTAVLFPGQGSQTSDMRDTVARLRPDLYELALDEVGNELFERANEKTEFAQPAIYCASLAGWSRFEGERPYAMAGHSLGELAALAASGAVDEATGLRLVALRGRLMQRVAERGTEGGMLALRTQLDEAAELAALFDDFRRRLAQAIIRPVQWRETLLSLDGWGVESFVEVGPGRVLTGLVRRTLGDAQAETLDRSSSPHTPPGTAALAPSPR